MSVEMSELKTSSCDNCVNDCIQVLLKYLSARKTWRQKPQYGMYVLFFFFYSGPLLRLSYCRACELSRVGNTEFLEMLTFKARLKLVEDVTLN